MMASRKSKRIVGACPECDSDIILKAPFLGQHVACPECLAELEVIGLSPIELDWVYEYGEYDYADEDEYRDESEGKFI